MLTNSINGLFHLDALSYLFIALVCFLGIVVGLFSKTFLQGDERFQTFFINLSLLISSLILLATADNLLLFLLAWWLSNLMIVQMMIHNPLWSAAKNSGWLALKTFTIGLISLASAFLLLNYQTGQSSIQGILHSPVASGSITNSALLLIILAALTQSAIWPFHRWLISSLNSPTPVSALMHAGIVNGGGFLLVRFAPLYSAHHAMLTFIFLMGLISAAVGTLWKLIQPDIKRMLACSTLGQMGFMLMQCGLGLFPAAVAHLCWHGLFKANLFLSSPSANQEKRLAKNDAPGMQTFIMALLCGMLGSFTFACISHIPWLANDTTLVLVLVVTIAATQIALPILQNTPWQKLPLAISATVVIMVLYGLSVYLVEKLLVPLQLWQPQPLTVWHMLGVVILVGPWLIMVFKNRCMQWNYLTAFQKSLYVNSLNASQPHPLSVTAHRNQYR